MRRNPKPERPPLGVIAGGSWGQAPALSGWDWAGGGGAWCRCRGKAQGKRPIIRGGRGGSAGAVRGPNHRSSSAALHDAGHERHTHTQAQRGRAGRQDGSRGGRDKPPQQWAGAEACPPRGGWGRVWAGWQLRRHLPTAAQEESCSSCAGLLLYCVCVCV